MKFRNRLVTFRTLTRRSFFIPALALAFVSACEKDPRILDQDGVQPNERSGIAGDSGDGLIIGHRLMAAGEYDLALKSYTRAVSDTGLTVDVVSAIGSANLRLGRLGQAETYLRQAVEIDEGFVPAWNNLGVTLISLGKYSEAREVFKVAYGLDRGESTEIRENLLQAEAKLQETAPEVREEPNFRLVRRGNGKYLLLGK